LFELGDRERAETLAEAYLSAVRAGSGIAGAISSAHFLSWTLTPLGRGDELAAALQPYDAPWTRAAIAFCEGNPLDAARIFAEMGAATEEAYVRLAAARLFVEQGRRAEADAQLQYALAFYRAVGASRYVREGQALLAATA
jgi:hypothetical protein